MSLPKVAVVILNWNGKHYLESFLPALEASTYPNLELVVGDNASGDGSVEYLKARHPHIRIIGNEVNLGFAGGYNEVLKQVEADYLVLLNSDVEVTPGWIEPVISLMESDPLIAAAQPKIKAQKEKTSFEYAGAAGGYLDHYGYPFCRGRIFDTLEQDMGQYDRDTEVFWASGAAFFIRRQCWAESGGLDTDFFAHMEEIDLCWRLKNMGYRIMCCAASEVYHVGGGTLNAESPYKTYLNFRNNLVMLIKNLPPGAAVWTVFLRLWLDLLSLVKFLADGKLKNAWAVSRAHQYLFLNLRKISRKMVKDTARFNDAGYYRKSIVWQYFGRARKKFSDLGGTL